MNKKIKITMGVLLALLILITPYGLYYVNDYYQADESISIYLNGTDNVTVSKTDNILFLDGYGNDSALIFYPGAKVEYTSYLPLLMNLSNNGVDCFIVEMPYNLAIFGKDSADSIISNDSYNYSKFYIAGHSLGGSMASSYASENSENITALILFASYPTGKIENMSVLSIYGSEDNILNKENYDNAKKYLPENYTEYVIDGGNHAYFGSYGEQAGDGRASITCDEQIQKSVDKILEFINKL